MPAPFESPAKTGKNTAVVAVFEFISVKKTIKKTTNTTTIKMGTPSMFIFSPIQDINPEL